jgi:hypothetical protein
MGQHLNFSALTGKLYCVSSSACCTRFGGGGGASTSSSPASDIEMLCFNRKIKIRYL